jgi:acyl-CoA hydrolase
MTPPKTPADSALELKLAFSTDAALRDQYVNNRGDMRFGLVLELLDQVAGDAAWKYVGEDKRGPLTLVTASADRIDLLKPVSMDKDMAMKAMVNHVGTSSMEVGVRVESGTERVASAYFTMVCLDDKLKPTPAPPLTLATELERERWQNAECRKQARLAARGSASAPPTPEEFALIHDLHRQRANGTLQGIPLACAQYTNLVHMYPQDKNLHNTVFGGYLMRIAYEHAWNVARLYSKERPLIACVDRIDFIKPVELGALVQMNAGVRHVGRTSMQVEVDLKSIDPAKGSSCLTNTCWFTFVARDSQGQPFELPKVYPETYEQALQYIEGRRKYLRNKGPKPGGC